MSRSYRAPYVVQSNGSPHRKWAKRQANKKVRRTSNISDGKAYRKLYDPWNICDYKWFLEKPLEDEVWISSYSGAIIIITLEEQLKKWKRLQRK